MSPELIGILTVGIGMFAWLRQDMGGRIGHLERRTNDRIGQLESQTNERFERLENQTNERFDQMGDRIDALERDHQERFASPDRGQGELRERMAKLEGLLEGLREAITERRAAS